MAIATATQGLVAAFSFGIVVNTASAALYLHANGHGSSIFRDGPRLALAAFLLCSALWAQVDFITILIDTTAKTACQVGISLSTLFDQFARFFVAQYLLWAINSGYKLSAATFVPQVLVLARFVLGCVFVGFGRTQNVEFCLLRSSVLALAIAVLAMDAVIILSMVGRSIAIGLFNGIRMETQGASRSRSLLIILGGFALWTTTSTPMILGLQTIDMVFRTTVPAIGLILLIVIVMACEGRLFAAKTIQPSPPEAPTPRNIHTSRSISTSTSTEYPPSRFEDLKAIDAAVPPPPSRQGGTRENGPLPKISRPITGVVGVGGVPLQGALFPPPREEITAITIRTDIRAPERPENVRPKRNLLALPWGGSAARGGAGQLTISSPVLLESADNSPLKRIRTVGLAEAAIAERERRAEALNRASGLIAKRPAPLPPTMQSRGPGPRKSGSIERKEVPRRSSEANYQQAGRMLSTFMFPPVATTTATQLSPGLEELRRRSPRPIPPARQDARTPPLEAAKSVGETVSQPPLPPPPSGQEATAQMSPEETKKAVDPTFRPVKLAIRPSRQLPPSPKTPPAKTPLELAATSGLPKNPRAQALKAIEKESGTQRQQTVMFINNITYNDPTMVQNVIDEANGKKTKQQRPVTPQTASSVLNRPRPIPRQWSSSEERGIFYGEPSPTSHRRSRSGGSIASRKSIFKSNPGTPTELPPLPLFPMIADPPSVRPQPNGTKSMTVGEKMSKFLPAQDGSHPQARSKPTASSPQPRISFLKSASSPSEGARVSRRSSLTTKATMETNILDLDTDVRERQDGNGMEELTPEAIRSLADEIGNTWLPGISGADTRQTPVSLSARKRASSPVLPTGQSGWTMSTDTRTQTDAATNWGSVYSPVEAVNMPVIRQAPRTTYIQKAGDPSRSVGDKLLGAANARLGGDGDELMTVMLDLSPQLPMRTLASGERPGDSAADLQPTQWHRRVGDDCPSFSDRKETVRGRKMPPPTPLLLNAASGSSKKPAVIMRVAEPSPEESPDHALHMIQMRLSRLDGGQRPAEENPNHKIALLDDLEKEMGLQENRWHEMQHDLRRGSVSPAEPSANGSSAAKLAEAATSPAAKPFAISKASERREARNARFSMGARANRNSLAPVDSRANMWYQRLADAEKEYAENADSLLAAKRNFFAVSNAQLGSPTPPDSDQSDADSNAEAEVPRAQFQVKPVMRQVPRRVRAPEPSLWIPAAPAKPPREVVRLWRAVTRPPKQVSLSTLAMPPPQLSRPSRKPTWAPLAIDSSALWQHTAPSAELDSSAGLWRPAATSSVAMAAAAVLASSEPPLGPQRAPRPLTQRPPRRSRRVTALPDILEDPQPLPDKRGTLGIYQFPWGERSDTATIRPYSRPPGIFMAMPGTMTSGARRVPGLSSVLDMRAQQLAAQEYSSSFFDDYDDEAKNSDMEGSEEDDESDGDDAFDESTLWEIASLLKTDGVPTTMSLLPPTLLSPSVVDEYLSPLPEEAEVIRDGEESDGGDLALQSIVVGLDGFPSAPFEVPVSDAPKMPQVVGDVQRSSLWKSDPPSMPAGNMALGVAAQATAAGLWNAPAGIEEITTETGKAALVTRTSRRPQVSHLEELKSSNLWAAPNTKEAERSWISSKIPRPTNTSRHQYVHRDLGSMAAWDSALQAALQASYPAKSSPQNTATFNPATTHPVFAAASLVSTTECSHPAATGYTHDPAKVHPVFFGSLTVTCPEACLHPAMASLVQKEDISQGPYMISEAASSARIMSQVEALEQERELVEQAVRNHFRQQQEAQSNMQLASSQTNEVIDSKHDSSLWTPGKDEAPATKPAEAPAPARGGIRQLWNWAMGKPKAETRPDSPTGVDEPKVTEDEEAVSRRLSRARSRQLETTDTPLPPQGEAGSRLYSLWSLSDAEARAGSAGVRTDGSAEKDWLRAGEKRASVVILRY